MMNFITLHSLLISRLAVGVVAIVCALTLGLSGGAVFAQGTTDTGTGTNNGGSTSQTVNNLSCGAGLQLNADGDCTAASEDSEETLNNVIRVGLRTFQIVVGIIAVGMLIYAGLRYITSGGSSSGVESARKTIIYALIGLVVVALSEVIIRFVLTTVDEAANTTALLL